MQFSLKKMFAVTAVLAVVALVVSIPLGNRHRSIARGIRHANETWSTNAIIYEYPTRTTALGGRRILHYIDRETGLSLTNRRPSWFEEANNLEIGRLLEENGAPSYAIAIAEKLPTDTELKKMFSSGKMELIENFPTNLTDSIRLEFNDRLEIRTSGTESRKGALFSIDYPAPVYTAEKDSIVYIRSGTEWMGVFLPDGRFLFDVF